MKSCFGKIFFIFIILFAVFFLNLSAQSVHKKAVLAKKSVSSRGVVKSTDKKPISKPLPFTDSFSYALGLNYAEYVLGQGIKVNPKDVAKGMSDVIDKRRYAIDSAEILRIIQRVVQRAINDKVDERKRAFSALLEQNKKNPKIKEILPGLQYEVLKDTVASGNVPVDSNKVTVHYTGRLLTGAVFDSSEDRGEPVSFRVDQVIPGWQEALKKMHKGDVWKVFIASDLAYGDRGNATIPGGAGLIFTIRLLDIN